MTTFDKREEAFERQFVRDEELKFKAGARRNRLLGLWVAERLGITGAQAEAYAGQLVVAEVDGGEAGVIGKVTADLERKGVASSAEEISAKMEELTQLAMAQVKAGV
jgi:hypothetical protein